MKSTVAPKLTGWHVLAILAGFFGVIFAVNGYFVYVAESTFSGIETKNPYLKGLDYNDEIAQDAAQRNLGWAVTLSQEHGNLVISYADRDGHSVDGLKVTAAFMRAANDRHDTTRVMKAIGGGRYGTPFDLPLNGQWRVRIVAQGPNQFHYITEDKIYVSPQ